MGCAMNKFSEDIKRQCVELIKEEECTGCGACRNICSLSAISMNTDKEGFWYPAIDGKKCIRCGRCADVCPVLHVEEADLKNKRQPEIYAAWSLNQEIRYHSTSGGIFSELAQSILSDEGYICGAIYDEQHMVKHFITNSREDLKMLRQSKYVQSDMCNIYREIENILNTDKKLLFCGTPCQCSGIFKYCKKQKINTEKLYLIDFICRGSNSPKVYEKFLKELGEKYRSDVTRVWFKNKTYGWNRFSTKVEFENGKCYLQDRYHDTYIRGYIEENLFIRPSCEHCKFKGFQRVSDMTLADFWGVQLEGRMQDSDGGTSMVMVNTEKGEQLWKTVNGRVYQTKKKIEDVLPGNVCFDHSVQRGVHREEFMKNLNDMPVIDNIERFLKNNNE